MTKTPNAYCVLICRRHDILCYTRMTRHILYLKTRLFKTMKRKEYPMSKDPRSSQNPQLSKGYLWKPNLVFAHFIHLIAFELLWCRYFYQVWYVIYVCLYEIRDCPFGDRWPPFIPSCRPRLARVVFGQNLLAKVRPMPSSGLLKAGGQIDKQVS